MNNLFFGSIFRSASTPSEKHAGRTMMTVTALLLLGALATPVRANVIPVNTTADGGSAGLCALRDAVTSANTDALVNGCPAGGGADTIVFNVSGTIMLSSELTITDPAGLSIDGTGQSITLSGNDAVRVIVVAGVPLNLKYLTVGNGFAERGAGVLMNRGSLTATNSTFTGNRAGCGGAIYSPEGSLSIINSTFSGNIAGASGVGCGSASGSGGALFSGGSVTIINSTFSGNSGQYGAQILLVDGSLNLANTILANSTSGEDCLIFGSSVVPSGKNMVVVRHPPYRQLRAVLKKKFFQG